MLGDTVASIMVTYNPDSDVVENAKSIVQSCAKLIIIDNGSNPGSKVYLQELEKEQKMTIIWNKENVGLGRALNQGIQFILNAEELRHVKWIATFDQDSTVQADYFEKMLQSYEGFSEKEAVAILAPSWVEQKLETDGAMHGKQNLELQEQRTVITSGSLMKKEAFQKIGFFEEDYFIDFLDHELCLRARSHGYKIFIVPQVTMLHNLGNTQEHALLGSRVKATNHNYIRRYYITRNRLYTYKKYFRTEKEWIKEDFIATAKEFIIILLFEQNRLKKLGSMTRGVWDALRGKKGAL